MLSARAGGKLPGMALHSCAPKRSEARKAWGGGVAFQPIWARLAGRVEVVGRRSLTSHSFLESCGALFAAFDIH